MIFSLDRHPREAGSEDDGLKCILVLRTNNKEVIMPKGKGKKNQANTQGNARVSGSPASSSTTVVVPEKEAEVVDDTPSLDSQRSSSDAAAVKSSSSAQTASILTQLSAIPVETLAVSVPIARFIDPDFDLIERIVSNENAGDLDEETLKNVRETVSTGFTAALMAQKLECFPHLFSFSVEYKAGLSEEVVRQQQAKIEKIQRLCIVNVLKANIKKLSSEDRRWVIDIVEADTVEKLSALLREYGEKVGNFFIGMNLGGDKRDDEKILHKKLHKKIRQEFVFHLVSCLFDNMELMQKNENMTLLFNLVIQTSSVNSYVYFKFNTSKLGLNDISNIDVLDQIFTEKAEYDSFQSKLQSCYEALLEKRKSVFADMAKVLVDLRFMQADKIYKLVALFHPNKTARESYEMLKQQAHEFNMPDFTHVFSNSVDEKEFVYIQERLNASYFQLKEEREKLIRSMCVRCSDTEFVPVGSLNKARLIELVNRVTSQDQCHVLFKQYAVNFGIEGFSEIFGEMIYKEPLFLQSELRYQSMRLSIKEKFSIPSHSLIEDEVLQLRIFANELGRSESVGGYLGITEFDLLPEWQEEAKFLAHKAVAEAAMIFRNVNPALAEEIKGTLTTKERCKAVYDLVYMRHITIAEKGFTLGSVIGLADGTFQVKHLVASKGVAKPPSLHDSRFALHQQSQASASTPTVVPAVP